MSVECSSRSYSQELAEKERLAQSQIDHALESGDVIAALRSQRILDVAEETRRGFRLAGVSLFQFKVLKGNSPTGGSIAMGAYEQEVDHVGAVGLAQLEDLDQTAAPLPVANQVEATIEHEMRHRQSHQNALVRGESGLIRSILGEDIDHDLQEAMASQRTTEGIDTYDPERARASQFAARIGMTRSQVSQLLLEGREAEIIAESMDHGVFDKIS